MSEQVREQPKREDRIKISEEVIATIAGIAASGNENVASMGEALSTASPVCLAERLPARASEWK